MRPFQQVTLTAPLKLWGSPRLLKWFPVFIIEAQPVDESLRAKIEAQIGTTWHNPERVFTEEEKQLNQMMCAIARRAYPEQQATFEVFVWPDKEIALKNLDPLLNEGPETLRKILGEPTAKTIFKGIEFWTFFVGPSQFERLLKLAKGRFDFWALLSPMKQIFDLPWNLQVMEDLLEDHVPEITDGKTITVEAEEIRPSDVQIKLFIDGAWHPYDEIYPPPKPLELPFFTEITPVPEDFPDHAKQALEQYRAEARAERLKEIRRKNSRGNLAQTVGACHKVERRSAWRGWFAAWMQTPTNAAQLELNRLGIAVKTRSSRMANN